jgi:hypothetical protein
MNLWRLCLALVLAVLAAVPARAQQFDPFDRLGTIQPRENLFGRDRAVGVLDRPRPAYAAQPVRAGRFEILPQLLGTLENDDNVFATERDTVSDAILRLRPRVAVNRPDPDLSLSLAGEAELTRYASRQSENSDAYALEGRARYVVDRDTNVDLRLLRARAIEERTDPSSLNGLARPNRFDVTEAYGEVRREVGRARVRTTLDWERRDYRDNRTRLGAGVDQDFRDRATLTLGVIGEYALSPSFAVFVAGSANKRDYRPRIGPLPARDSRGWDVAAGASFELGKLMRGALRLGYLKQDYRSPVFRDVGGVLVRGELSYFVTPLVTVTATADRSVVETGVVEAAGYLRTAAGVRVDYELLRNLILQGEAGYEKRRFNAVERRDDRFAAGLSATWLINRRLSLKGELRHRGQDSAGPFPGRQFAQNRALVSLVFKGL